MSLGLDLCAPQAWGNAQTASFSKEAYRYEQCCHLILQGWRYFLWCPESDWLFPTPYFLKMSVWGIFSWKFRTPTSSLWWLPHHFCLQNEAPSVTQLLFFLTWKIPRLHSYTNFLPEWFLVRGQYPYFFFLFIARWFDFLWHAAFFPPSNSLTEKNYILKPIPASFIMKVRAEMATEWTPRMFFSLSYRNYKCWMNN